MSLFHRDGDTVRAVLDESEAQLVRRLVTDVRAMLRDPAEADAPVGLEALLDPSPVAPPEDPAMARLLPDGYRDDPQAAAELRRLTEPSLREAKSEAARHLLDSLPDGGGSLTLDLPTAEAWLTALNDVRLVLGTRLGVTEDTAENEARGLEDGDDPVAIAYQVYCWLSVAQDELVAAVCD